MSDDEFLAWLERPARRCILVEIDTDTPLLLSDRGYVTAPGDTPANVLYRPAVAGGVSLSEALPLSGTARLSYGDVELHNEDGSLDGLLETVVEGRAIRIYYGDPAWPRAEFRLQVAGIVARLRGRDRGRLNIVLQDRLTDLAVPVSDVVIGGSGVNKDLLQPQTFGEAHNVSAVLEDAATHLYRVHGDAMEGLIEARDDGAPTAVTVNAAAGTFSLTQNPKGLITASVQGDKTGGTYRNTIGALIALLASKYAGLDQSEIDSDNLAAFDAAHPQPVGLSVTDRRTVLQCCQDLAASVGAQVVMSRLGQLQVTKLELPTPSVRDIRPQDYERGSCRLAGEPDIVAAVKIAYCRSWVVQGSLETGIPDEHKTLFGREWLTATAVSEITATTYRLPVDAEQEDTLLLREADAQAEAQRRLDLWKVPRRVIRLVGFAHLLPLGPGMGVTLYNRRFGLASGRAGIIISARPNWSAARNEIEILI